MDRCLITHSVLIFLLNCLPSQYPVPGNRCITQRQIDPLLPPSCSYEYITCVGKIKICQLEQNLLSCCLFFVFLCPPFSSRWPLKSLFDCPVGPDKLVPGTFGFPVIAEEENTAHHWRVGLHTHFQKHLRTASVQHNAMVKPNHETAGKENLSGADLRRNTVRHGTSIF